jgi:hypothetical protein
VENTNYYQVIHDSGSMTRKQVIELLRASGVNVPIELECDYSGLAEPEKMKEFVRLTSGNWRNAIYVVKEGERYGDMQYFDLLLAIHETGKPICIPVPLARKFFGEMNMRWGECFGMFSGRTYERIYAAYYKRRSEGTQDDLPF